MEGRGCSDCVIFGSGVLENDRSLGLSVSLYR